MLHGYREPAMAIEFQSPTFSLTLPPASPPLAAGTWIAPELSMLPLAARRCVVRNVRTGAFATATPESHGLLRYCDRFRTLAEHAQVIGTAIPGLAAQRAWVLQQLDSFCRAGILVRPAEVVAGWIGETAQAAAPPGPAEIVVRTCDRPALLARLLASVAGLPPGVAASCRFTVLDDSHGTDARERNRASCAAAQPALAVGHVVLDAAEDWIADLRAAFPGAHAELDWLLGAGVAGATYGRPVNYALLRHAGRRLLTIDDDVVVAPRCSPRQVAGFVMSSAPDQWDFHRSRAELEASCAPLAIDPFAAHLGVLGASLAAATASLGPGLAAEALCAGLAAPDLDRLDRRSAVLFTQNGALGDPGSALHPFPLYAADDEAFARFTANAADYALLARVRYNWRGQPRARIACDRPLTFTTLAGLDNRKLLPPTVPALRNEDLLLGAVARVVHPHSVAVDLPWSLLHLRDPEKCWEPLASPTPQRQDVVHVLLELVAAAAPACRAEAPEDRLRYLGRVLQDWGAAGESTLREMLEQHLLDTRTRIAFELQESLDRHPAAPAWWRRDVEAYLRGPNLALARADLGAALADAGTVRGVLAAYGRALDVWPELWAYRRRAVDM